MDRNQDGMEWTAFDLYHAYSENKIPRVGGFVITKYFTEHALPVRFEITALNSIGSIARDQKGLTFRAGGKRIYILVGSAPLPSHRAQPFAATYTTGIPHRPEEMRSFGGENGITVMMSERPVCVVDSFIAAPPSRVDFAFFFFKNDSARDALTSFFHHTLVMESRLPADTAERIMRKLKKDLSLL